jgi:hypothetical protein
MSLVVLELSPAIVTIDETRFPDPSEGVVFEHLRHYCAKFQPIPAIVVRLTGGKAIVVRGQNYLRIARELGHQSVRAIVDGTPDDPEVASFISRPDVIQLDWKGIDEEERRKPVVRAWHVFFFARPLEETEQKAFESEVAGFFDGLTHLGGARVGPVHYFEANTGAEFEALTPVANNRWVPDFRIACEQFDIQRVPIVSYQGTRFRLADSTALG